jgi:predicted ATP-binding protein involved in virulence
MNKQYGNHVRQTNNGYLKRIHLRNFFCINDLKIDGLQEKKEIYIVGENGEGKTILLQGILLAFKGDRNVGEIINFIRQNPLNNCHLEAVDDTNSSYVFSENVPVREYIAKNVFAYGVHRIRNDSDKADEYGYLTLFEDNRYLRNPVKWLQYLHHKEKAKEKPPIGLDTAISMLKSLLEQNVEIEVTPDAVTFIERKTKVEFSQLADGYKSVIVWVCDLLEKLSKNQPGVKSNQDFKGIVLLDEIELFLHPKWKYRIVSNLRR